MPDTAEHRAAMYALAQSRMNAGVPSWAGSLDLVDVYRDEGLDFVAKRDAIVARIRGLPAYVAALDDAEHPEREGHHAAKDVVALVERLATVEEVRGWDLLWGGFYDWADITRIWVKTF